MSNFDEILEYKDPKALETPTLVKVLAVLSIIGNGFLLLIFIIMTFVSLANKSSSFRFEQTDFKTLMIIVLVSFTIIVLSIIGAYQMYKGKKRGFILYAIPNSIWGILLLIGNNGFLSNIILGLISIAFVIVFSTQYKKLN